MLKIEGKGSNQGPRYDYEYELARKQADRDIRAELRKIYNLKPSPKKHSRRIVELPRLNWIIFDVVIMIITLNIILYLHAQKKWRFSLIIWRIILTGTSSLPSSPNYLTKKLGTSTMKPYTLKSAKKWKSRLHDPAPKRIKMLCFKAFSSPQLTFSSKNNRKLWKKKTR